MYGFQGNWRSPSNHAEGYDNVTAYPVRYSTSALRVLCEERVSTRVVRFSTRARFLTSCICRRHRYNCKEPRDGEGCIHPTEGRSKTDWTGNEYVENKVYERQGLQERQPPCLTTLAVDGDELEEVNKFVYLGSLVTADNDTSQEIQTRILAGNRAYFGLRKTLTSDVQNTDQTSSHLRP